MLFFGEVSGVGVLVALVGRERKEEENATVQVKGLSQSGC